MSFTAPSLLHQAQCVYHRTVPITPGTTCVSHNRPYYTRHNMCITEPYLLHQKQYVYHSFVHITPGKIFELPNSPYYTRYNMCITVPFLLHVAKYVIHRTVPITPDPVGVSPYRTFTPDTKCVTTYRLLYTRPNVFITVPSLINQT